MSRTDSMVRMSERVLLIEDDRSVREIATLVLAQAGFCVTAVADGLAGVDAALSDAHDMVVLDLMLPGLDGLDICRAIRVKSHIPIVMLTARTDPADVVSGLESGADDYV